MKIMITLSPEEIKDIIVKHASLRVVATDNGMPTKLISVDVISRYGYLDCATVEFIAEPLPATDLVEA